MADRPFKVLGIQQIAVGALDKSSLRTFWVDTLGLEVVGTFRSERENVDEETLLEIAAYYIPWVDNLLDTIATPAAIVAGSLLIIDCLHQ